MGITATIRIIAVLLVVVILTGGMWYVSNLRADLVVSRTNEEKLKDGIKEQTALLDAMKKDIESIQKINKDLSEQNQRQKKDVDDLNKKFQDRKLGSLASSQPEKMKQLVDRGTVNALRCIELASGSPLNDKEKAAKTPVEANRECPQLISTINRPIN